jgi:hypothetical protein
VSSSSSSARAAATATAGTGPSVPLFKYAREAQTGKAARSPAASTGRNLRGHWAQTGHGDVPDFDGSICALVLLGLRRRGGVARPQTDAQVP